MYLLFFNTLPFFHGLFLVSDKRGTKQVFIVFYSRMLKIKIIKICIFAIDLYKVM